MHIVIRQFKRNKKRNEGLSKVCKSLVIRGATIFLMSGLLSILSAAQTSIDSPKKPRADAPALVFLSLSDTGFASPVIRVKKQSMQFTIVNSSPSLTVELEIRKYQANSLRSTVEPQSLKSVAGRYKASGTIDLPPGRYRVQQKGIEQWGFDLIVEVPNNVE